MQRRNVLHLVSTALSRKVVHSVVKSLFVCLFVCLSYGFEIFFIDHRHDFHMISGYFGIGQNQAFNCPSASREASVVVAGAALALMGRKATAPTVKQLVRAAQ